MYQTFVSTSVFLFAELLSLKYGCHCLCSIFICCSIILNILLRYLTYLDAGKFLMHLAYNNDTLSKQKMCFVNAFYWVGRSPRWLEFSMPSLSHLLVVQYKTMWPNTGVSTKISIAKYFQTYTSESLIPSLYVKFNHFQVSRYKTFATITATVSSTAFKFMMRKLASE